MAYKTKSMSTIKQVLLRHRNGESNRSIAKALSISKNTVNKYVDLAKNDQLSIETLTRMDDIELDFRFNGGSPAYTDERYEDFMRRLPYFEEQMRRKHMTLQLLWEEYREEVPDGYGISQFRFHYRQNTVSRRAVTVLKDLYVGGDKLYLDYAGDTMEYIDRETGEIVKVQVFVAVLPASDYAFAMAVPSQRTEDFCHAIDCCLQTLGGVPRQLVPDNLKAAVVKADRYSPTINAALEQLANHYGCVVNPARAMHPKDKALVENAVKLVYRRVYEPLRNRVFYSIEELNEAIRDKVAAHNGKRVQGADYSRQERFASIDMPNLQPLPDARFEIISTTQAKVALNGCVYLGKDKHYYSVPHQHIGRNTTIRFTQSLVKVYVVRECVATHRRDTRKGGYTIEKTHLASHCNAYRDRSPQYYITRASHISETLKEVMELLFVGVNAPETLYRSADGLLSLCRSTAPDIMDYACRLAIDREKVSYGYINNLVKSIIVNGVSLPPISDIIVPDHENIRGPKNYK